MKKQLRYLMGVSLATTYAMGVQAQTDVTNDYLINPSFEYMSEGVTFNSGINSLSPGEVFYGWTAPNIQDGFVNIDINDNTNNNSGYGKTVAPSDGSFYFYNRKGWGNASAALSQTTATPLSVGRYYISFNYKAGINNNQNNVTATTLGLEIVQNGEIIGSTDNTYVTVKAGASFFNDSEWKTIGLWFDVPADEVITINVNEVLGGDGGRSDICIDNFRLQRWESEEAVNFANASVESPMDISYKVVNTTFDEGIAGWNSIEGFQNKTTATNQAGAFSGKFFEHWNNAGVVGAINQTITNLPAGKYELKIAAFGNNANSGSGLYVFANQDMTEVTQSTPLFYTVNTILAEGEELNIGLNSTTTTSNWIGIDNVSLYYLGEVASFKGEYDAVVEAALAALADEKYAVVTGIERAELLAETGKESPESEEGYQDAIKVIKNLQSAFESSALNYNALIDAKAKIVDFAAKKYASELRKNIIADLYESTAESGDEALAKVAEIEIEMRKYAESHALAEGVEGALDMTDLIVSSRAESLEGWNVSASEINIGILDGEKFIDGDGNSDYAYFDGWNGNAWALDFSQEVDLTAGVYMLTATGRCATGVTSFKVVANGESANIPIMGSSEGTFGFGWNDASVEFTLFNDGKAKIGILAESPGNNWLSFTRFRLVRLADATEDVTELKAEYDALISAVEESLSNDLYANVTGVERNDLLAEIAKEEPATAAEYGVAIENVKALQNIFESSVADYNSFADAKSEITEYSADKYPYASFEKEKAMNEFADSAAESKDDALAKTSEIKSAIRKYVESHALAEGVSGSVNMTAFIVNASAEGIEGWNNASEGIDLAILADEKFTDGDGNSDCPYFDGWNGSPWKVDFSQNIELVSGKYMLSVTARCHENVTSYELKANEEAVNIPIIGAAVGTGTFDRGWNDASVEFTLNTNGTANIGINAASEGNCWLSFTRFRLVRLGDAVITSIEDITTENQDMPADIYTIDGKLVKKAATDLNGLEKGFYIVGGKKVVID